MRLDEVKLKMKGWKVSLWKVVAVVMGIFLIGIVVSEIRDYTLDLQSEAYKEGCSVCLNGFLGEMGMQLQAQGFIVIGVGNQTVKLGLVE